MKAFSVGSRSATVFGLIAFLSLGLGMMYVPALAATTTEKQEIVFAEFHPCTGELVVLDGTVHLVTTITDNHVRTYFHAEAQGVGTPSGDRYVFNEGDTQEFDLPPGGTQTVYMRLEFIHAGESLGFASPALDDLHVRFRVTVGPGGTEVMQDRADCR